MKKQGNKFPKLDNRLHESDIWDRELQGEPILNVVIHMVIFYQRYRILEPK